jgi:hypothetical protein
MFGSWRRVVRARSVRPLRKLGVSERSRSYGEINRSKRGRLRPDRAEEKAEKRREEALESPAPPGPVASVAR